MLSKLFLTLIQTKIFWEKPVKNRDFIKNKIDKINSKVDIIILPEMFTSGFTMNPEVVSESMDGATIKWMKNIAKEYDSAIAGSIVIKEERLFYNRFLFVHPSGKIDFYDKKHTFKLAGEDKFYNSGNNSGLIEFRGWKICLRVCYDLRFPVWSRNINDYHLLIYVANWPYPRINAWDKLLAARAIENCSYSVGVNCLGNDPNGNFYPGHSSTYDFLGDLITGELSEKEESINTTLNINSLQDYRKKFQFLKDRDNFYLD
jgi:omega-amidase